MKRSLIVLFLIAVLTVPLFAGDKGKSELNVKLGIMPSPNLSAQINDIVDGVSSAGVLPLPPSISLNTNSLNNAVGISGKMGMVAGLDYFYYVENKLGIGLGINRVFPVTYLDNNIAEIDTTNIYLTAKREVKVESFLDAIYFLGRLGYGINNLDSSIDKLLSIPGFNLSADNGLYWALGIGFEKSQLLFEVVYSVNYSKLNVDINVGEPMKVSSDITLSAIGINIGYKFEL